MMENMNFAFYFILFLLGTGIVFSTWWGLKKFQLMKNK